MRIRRLAKGSAAVSTVNGTCAPTELLQPHVCRLNQSPWEAIAANSSSNDNKNNNNNQRSNDRTVFVDYSRFTRNHDSLRGDSIGASDNTTSTKRNDDDDKNGTETTIKLTAKKESSNNKRNNARNMDGADDNDEDGDKVAKKKKNKKKKRKKRKSPAAAEKRQGKGVRFCQKNDGKGWHCKKAAKEGCSFCEHHLSQFRSYNNNNNSNSSPGDDNYDSTPADAEGRRTRARKAGPEANPSEFYYYSGFGPRWGRKRSGGRESAATEEDDVADYVDEEDEDDGGDSGGGLMRIRRPVKARSLKSLM